MTTAVVKTETQLEISNPDDTLKLADNVADYIRKKKLFQNIQGREYVNVEGWQFAGSRLGILPIIIETKDLSSSNEIKYSATVNLVHLRTGNIVGNGYAVCSNKEGPKRGFQEYAICSMAQTRAIGKAYRNILAWIIRAAGYEPTPAEEMDFKEAEEVKEDKPGTMPKQKAEQKKPEAKEVKVEVLATPAQKKEIFRLLDEKEVPSDNRMKINKNIDKLNTEKADAWIDYLNSLPPIKKQA